MRILGPTLALTLLLSASAAAAQGAEVPFGGLTHDTTLPVEVTADKLEVDQTDGDAIFIGNVIVGQGEMRLSSRRLRVEYSEAVEGETRRIDRMHATGDVILSTGTEAAEAREAIYSIATGNVVLSGDVILTQGQNAMSGERFTVDLNTGRGVMEGRVKTILQTGGTEE